MVRTPWFGVLPFLGREHDSKTPPVQGLVLAGGGARASFQLGALRYLYDIAEIAPTSICATSAGAIVGAMLAQSSDRNEQSATLRAVESLWLGMDSAAQMFSERQWFAVVREHAPELLSLIDLGTATEPELNLDEDRGWPWMKLPFPWPASKEGPPASEPELPPQPVAPTSSAKTLNIALEEEPARPMDWTPSLLLQILNNLPKLGRLSGDLTKALRLAETSRSMYRTGAIILDLLGQFDSQRVQDSGMKVRLAIVGLNSGELRFMRQDGQIVDRDDSPIDGSAGDLSLGVLASCSIPGVFKPVQMGDEFYVDGGVRENVPVEMAVANLGVTRPYVITCNPSGTPHSDYQTRDLVSVMMRAATIMTDELERDEVAYAKSNGAIVIEPEILVHDTMMVDPGLLRINRDYGWMRAAEAHTQTHQVQIQLHRELIEAVKKV